MALKAKFTTEEDVPAGLEEFYTEQDGEWVLQVSGLVEKGVVDEFRQNNIALQKQVTGLEKQISKIDVEEYAQLKTQQESLSDQKLIEEGRVDDLVSTRVDRMRGEFETNIQRLQDELNETVGKAGQFEQNYNALIVERSLIDAAAKAGVRNEAIPDVLARAQAVWRKADDDSLVAMRGDQPVYGKNGRAPLGVEEWYEGLADEAPHLFKASEGSGALGGRSGNSARRISLYDSEALSDNLEAIAEGKITVVDS